MSLEILQRDREGIVLLELKGRIIAGPEVLPAHCDRRNFAGGGAKII